MSQINKYDLALSLPNNLTGYVPLTSISDKVTKQVEKLALEEDGADDQGNTAVDLASLFSIGRYLRASVISTQQEDAHGAKAKRHIELSIDPQKANTGLSKTDIVPNSMLQASIYSVEDHGIIMNLGLADTTIKGFMSSKELGPDIDISIVKEGSVHLCLVTGKSSNGSIIKLSADPSKIGAVKKGIYVTDAPTIDAFLPGTAVDFLVSEVTPLGISGKVMGVLDVIADYIHSGAASSGKDLEKKYSTGSKVRGRLICTFPTVEGKKLGMSLQDHIMYWRPKTVTSTNVMDNRLPTEHLRESAILENATVVKVQPRSSLLLDVGVKGVRGFVHISQVSDEKIETLSESTGPYKLGSQHKARILGYNPMDGLFVVSMEPKIINQPFLSVEDVKIGQIVKGTIEKIIIGPSGVSGLIVRIAEGVSGLVPETHFADIQLQHPERKFKEGQSVTARVLSINLDKKQIRLTFKKTLVNSDIEPWTSFENLQPGLQAPGSLINILQTGAVVQFYGDVRAFLPVSEMSESFIQDPKEHFRNGQVVNVRIVSVDSNEKRMIVSCKAPPVFSAAQKAAYEILKPGESVVGTVTEQTNNQIIVDLDPSELKATIAKGHLSDGSTKKSESVAKRIRIGQKLTDLIVLSKQDAKHLIRLTSKPSLVQAAKDGKLMKTFEDVVEGSEVSGFVKNVTLTGVYVQFAGDLTGLLLKHHLPEESVRLPEFGMQRNQSLTARVLSVDHGQRRFLLSMKPFLPKDKKEPQNPESVGICDKDLFNPVDGISSSINDFTLGKLTKARITSVKETQINVQLADAIQGRIDVSEIFDSWEAIHDRKHTLKNFKTKQILPVRILGMHDSRNHRFLPITHRGKAPVFELTAKPSTLSKPDLDVFSIDKVDVGSTWLAFVNNVSDDCVWVNLSPNVRGRIRAIDVSDNVSQLKDLAKNFPVGSVLKAKVLKVDIENNRLDLSARSDNSKPPLALEELSVGSILPGRVTKITERHIMVQLSDSLSGPVNVVDMADDYSKADPTAYQKNQITRVFVKNIDIPKKRVTFSTRPSKILSSSLPIRDRDIASISQLEVNDVVRGFIKNVADTGVFVALGGDVVAFIRVSDLSDDFLKDWKSHFEIDRLVEGKIIAVDQTLNHIRMSLKRSHLDKNYQPPISFLDMRYGQVVTGKIRKVEDFGVFIVVDGSANVSGLCHRTKMSDKRIVDPKKLYEEGDAVKAKVLNINKEKKQISFGLKASYFETKAQGELRKDRKADESSDENNISESDGPLSSAEEANGIDLISDSKEKDELDMNMNLDDIASIDSDAGNSDAEDAGIDVSQEAAPPTSTVNGFHGLSTGGFDWTGGASCQNDIAALSETDTESLLPKTKKRRRTEPKVDRTGDLDAHGPQSTADFERLLMSNPNSSVLWLEYMAFHLRLGEVPKSQEIAERALKTIHIREEGEKLNVWIAMLNLENTYGSDESVNAVFARACQYNDSLEIHSCLASIYIQSHAYPKADELFQAALKKHSQSPDLYINYATFLMTELDSADRARALLPRAMQALPPHTHLSLTSKLAQLEFTTPHGSQERGRTIFETMLSQWPKRLDLWNVLLDLEIKQGDKEIIRRSFERVTGSGTNLKARKAKFFFKKWLDWEMKSGVTKSQERVKALAAEYVRKQGKQAEVI